MATSGLCTAAQAIMDRVAPVADFIIVSADGDEFAVCKGLMAAASVVLACVLSVVCQLLGVATGQQACMHDGCR
jgi:hypothetical protein